LACGGYINIHICEIYLKVNVKGSAEWVIPPSNKDHNLIL
jgi:hypothetical protein